MRLFTKALFLPTALTMMGCEKPQATRTPEEWHDAVAKVLEQETPKLRACYDEAMKKSSGLIHKGSDGKESEESLIGKQQAVTVEVRVQANGTMWVERPRSEFTKSGTDRPDETTHGGLIHCVANLAGMYKIPGPLDSHALQGTWVILFKPEGTSIEAKPGEPPKPEKPAAKS